MHLSEQALTRVEVVADHLQDALTLISGLLMMVVVLHLQFAVAEKAAIIRFALGS